MTVTVYTTPVCSQCTLTKNWLTRKGIPFEAVDISQSPEAEALVRGLGYSSAPVVVAGAKSWSGFRPDLLALIAVAS